MVFVSAVFAVLDYGYQYSRPGVIVTLNFY
jgi:hypothetical protein